MVIKRRDFQKAAAFIHEFLLKMNEDGDCAELRDTLNLALLHMQKYYRLLQSRSLEKSAQLTLSARGLSPMTPFIDAPDKFRWRWVNLDSARLPTNMSMSESINLTSLPPIIEAVRASNLKVIVDIIRQDPHAVDHSDGIGRTGLMYAIHQANHHILNYLLDNGANVNATSHDGSTALHYACYESNAIAVSLLLDHHADWRILDTHGRASIHWAVTTKSTDCLELLLENSADPAVRDKDRMTPCMWACRMDNIKHFDMLCRGDYPITEPDGIERDANGRTWMHWAVRRTEPLECLQTLLTPESAHYRDEDGKTVLMLAAEIGSLPAARLILEIGGRETVDDSDDQLRTALHLATIGGHGDVVNFLLEQGADINCLDRYNATAWDYARNRQLHYCQLIIMSHQRQRMMSNPTTPLPNGLGLLMHSQESTAVQEGLSRMSFRTRSEQSTPITPPHPPKRPRTSRMLQRRANSLNNSLNDSLDGSFTTALQNRERGQTTYQQSAGSEKRKERIEVMVNTRLPASNTGAYNNPITNGTTNHAGVPFGSPSRQDSMLTEDMMNVMNDVEINEEDDIDNVSVGGMDVSDIEEQNEQRHINGHGHADSKLAESRGGQGVRPNPVPRPQVMGSRSPPQHHLARRQQPQPPGSGHQAVAPHPPVIIPSYTQPLEPPYSREDGVTGRGIIKGLQDDDLISQPHASQPRSPARPTPYGQQSLPRPALRLRGSPTRGPIPSPPNTDPQRPHMIRQQQPLPAPQPRENTARYNQHLGPNDLIRGEQVASPPLSSESSDKISSRTQVSVGVGPIAGGSMGGVSSPENRPTSGGTSKPPGGVAIEGRRIPPPMLTPLTNVPKLPAPDLFSVGMEPNLETKKKKKKKKNRVGATGTEKEREVKSPPQNPLDIPQPRGYAAPLHPQQTRGHSAALHGPKFSRGQPQHHEPRFVDENTEADDKPPVVNGYAVPVRDGSLRSAQPGQRTAAKDTDPAPGPAGDAAATNPEGVKESIAEEEEFDDFDLGGTSTLIPPPLDFQEPSPSGVRPLSQSVPQDKPTLRLAPTSAKPPLPRNRNSASLTRHSSDRITSPVRRSRPPTSKN